MKRFTLIHLAALALAACELPVDAGNSHAANDGGTTSTGGGFGGGTGGGAPDAGSTRITLNFTSPSNDYDGARTTFDTDFALGDYSTIGSRDRVSITSATEDGGIVRVGFTLPGRPTKNAMYFVGRPLESDAGSAWVTVGVANSTSDPFRNWDGTSGFIFIQDVSAGFVRASVTSVTLEPARGGGATGTVTLSGSVAASVSGL